METPWLLSIFAGIWFWFLGKNYAGRAFGWAAAGAIFALVTSTLVVGVCNASFIPHSHEEQVSFGIQAFILALLPTFLVSGSMMLMLSRRYPKKGSKAGRVYS
jgi:hypothetical protein